LVDYGENGVFLTGDTTLRVFFDGTWLASYHYDGGSLPDSLHCLDTPTRQVITLLYEVHTSDIGAVHHPTSVLTAPDNRPDTTIQVFHHHPASVSSSATTGPG